MIPTLLILLIYGWWTGNYFINSSWWVNLTYPQAIAMVGFFLAIGWPPNAAIDLSKLPKSFRLTLNSFGKK